ncbi:ABC-type antimicrobial peptide transport system permease subunit [Actinoplanes couchii]|uniref:ABC3 transporter permease C-terminal domain-containing protein n=1 Tax=Actinoplanes couchii TaxID=403638 RepID=A0ABQ3XAX3_9ACTN|nr:ABC-type antimicrobial peptide transport system permease subunit [Actinoplanes couchii]GID55667.1 hypothetical protein Aco03nite_040710 [Actinoplanes couchii]
MQRLQHPPGDQPAQRDRGGAHHDQRDHTLGATRGQIRVQFVAESLLLSVIGGAGGVLAGFGVTLIYAAAQGWPAVVPLWAVAGGLGATLLIGAVAGLYPAIRAARLAPTEALAA